MMNTQIPHPMTDGFKPSFWLKLSDENTIVPGVGDGAEIAKDISGDNNNVSQIIPAAQPETGIATLNGKNVLSFDGTQRFEGSNYFGFGDWTIFFVGRTDDGTNEWRLMSQRNQFGNQTMFDIYHGTGSPTVNLNLFDGNTIHSGGSVTIGTPFQATFRLKQGQPLGDIRINGTSTAFGFTFNPSSAAYGFLLGDFGNFRQWRGIICEPIIVPYYLSLQTVRWKELYLHNEWQTLWNDSL